MIVTVQNLQILDHAPRVASSSSLPSNLHTFQIDDTDDHNVCKLPPPYQSAPECHRQLRTSSTHTHLTQLSANSFTMAPFTFQFSRTANSPLLLSISLFFLFTCAHGQPPTLKGACIDAIAKTAPDAKPRHQSLHHAASDSSIESACLLLYQGADINGRNKCVGCVQGGSGCSTRFARLLLPTLTLCRQNLTALHASILPSEKAIDMVQLLLQHGADVNAKNWCVCLHCLWYGSYEL